MEKEVEQFYDSQLYGRARVPNWKLEDVKNHTSRLMWGIPYRFKHFKSQILVAIRLFSADSQ